MIAETVSDLDQAEADRWQPPPEPQSIYEFSKRVILHDGPLEGTALNPPAERAVELWLRMLESRKYRWHVIVAPSQRSKTLSGILIPTMHALIEERLNVGWIMPNLDKLNQKWEGTIKPMVEGGGFKGYMPDKGPSSKGGRPAALTWRDPKTGRRLATLYAMALGKGGSETSTASNPCARLLIDEADDAENAGQIKLAMKRTASYGHTGGGIVASTVNERRGRDLHPILELYSEGTQSRLAHLCPHCGIYVVPDLEHFDVARAAITCPNCAVLWSESDRHKARNAGEYKHANPDAAVFSVLYNQLDYFWEYPDRRTGEVELVLPALANEHRGALAAKERGDPSQWDTYLRKSWCRAEATDDSDVVQSVDLVLASRAAAEAHKRGEVPEACKVVAIGSDTGKRDAFALAVAMDEDRRWWVSDWDVSTVENYRGEPTPQDQVDMLDGMREKMRRLPRADSMGIDVGYNTDLVVKWAAQNGFDCVRGDSRPMGKKDEDRNKHLPSWADARRQDDGSVWIFIDGAEVKKELHKSLARSPGAPGAGHLPHGEETSGDLISHITSESYNAKDGKWYKRRGRENHYLDCLVYAWALCVIRLNLPPPPKEEPLELPLMNLQGIRI